MSTTITKNSENIVKLCDIKTLFTQEPSKAKVQELKWKSTINRQSLPNELPKLPIKNIIMEVKSSNRRKTESDIDLNIDNYNINPLEKEKIEYSRKKKHKKKCTKTHCSLISDKKKKTNKSKSNKILCDNSIGLEAESFNKSTNVFNDLNNPEEESFFDTTLKLRDKSLKKSKKILNSNGKDKGDVNTCITKIKLFKQKSRKITEMNKFVNTSENCSDDIKAIPYKTRIKLSRSKKNYNILNEISSCENSSDVEQTSPEKLQLKVMKNAFSVMMEARNNIIGSNLEGEEKSKENDISPEENMKVKIKLKSRKNLLENWANEKGAKKRKLKEDVREEYVLKTLDRRAKKFKAMLELSNYKTPENSTHVQEQKLNPRTKRSTDKLKTLKDNELKEATLKTNLIKNNDVSCSTPKISKNVLSETYKSKVYSNDKSESLDVSSCRILRTRKTKINYIDIINENNSSAMTITDDIIQKSVPKRDKESKNKSLKLAPLFIKKPASKEDKKTFEAKKSFLQSGLPDQCIKIIEKQKRQENYEYTLFPSISHVLQLENIEYNSNTTGDIWNSFCKKINHLWNPIFKFDNVLTLGLFTNCSCSVTSCSYINIQKPILHPPTTYPDTIRIIKEFKKFNSKFPASIIYRNFKARFDSDINNESKYLMWTEKYKSISSQEIIGNTKSVAELKEWLSTWVENSKNKSNYCEKDSDFIDSDTESRDRTSSNRTNTIVLVGPNGSGKTTSVYAIANDLNVNVLEINASSQRNGKRILNDIHEATQSRHFRENLYNCVQLKRCKNSTKYSLILIEDIDIVFSVIDDGFLGAINNIIMSGKRPVILTSSDSYSIITQKYMSENKTLKFHSISSSLTTPWLQIISIMEGIWPNEQQVTELYNLNNKDLRKTLLDLQFLILSGYNIRDKLTMKETVEITNLSLKSFLNWEFFLPNPINLCDLYWILHNTWDTRLKIENTEQSTKSKEKSDIDKLSTFFDNLALVDVAYVKNGLECSFNPAVNIWKSEFCHLSNSLSINTNLEMYKSSIKLTQNWTHCLLSKSIDLADLSTNEDLNWKTFSMDKITLKRQTQSANSKLLNGISLSSHLGPRNLGTDYFAYLRAINRTEDERTIIYNKRRRFCNYLKSLNIHYTETQRELLLSSLTN